uniref:Uncharacterized protein n=1 Tax=Babesia bovis TaxID=5865 RepID=S6BIH8_BABBO|nr:hypothetical protein [Babesia bovis]
MQYQQAPFVPRSTPPPRMVTSTVNVPVNPSAGAVFRRQNTAGRFMGTKLVNDQPPFKPSPGCRVPMMMPRCSTASVTPKNMPGYNAYPQGTPLPQPRSTPTNIKTVVLPQHRQGTTPSPMRVVARETSPMVMPRQATAASRKSFVPSSYVSNVYPSYPPAGPSRAPTSPLVRQQRSNTAAFTQQSGIPRPQGHVAFRGRNQTKGSSAQRRPSVFNEMVAKIKENVPSFPTVEAKEAAQLVGGFVSGTLSVLAHIVGDIRGDIINGLFKPEDPSYDAAKAYYYANNNHPPMPTGMTQRIDYIEEIERCSQARSNSRHRVTPKKPQAVPQPHHQVFPEPLRQQPAFNHHQGAPAARLKERPTAFGQDPNMFAMMSERSLEEFLNEGYLSSAPPSIPR